MTATPVTLAPALAAQCRNARAQIVPGAGHWVQYEAADPVNGLLADWMIQPTMPAGG